MKKSVLTILGICLITFITQTQAFAQGCVAIRTTGGICAMNEHSDSSVSTGYWLLNSNSRYYKSFRHFVGKQEQFYRIDSLHNNVINEVFTEDLTLTRIFDSRWSIALDVPINTNSRSQVLGNTNGTRFSTHSFGLGDVSFSGYYWLVNPAKSHKGNVQVGLGIKFATGNNNVQDYFLTNAATGEKTLKLVDQSIQLGDGGTGIITNINAYYNFTSKFGVYGTFYYLINPQDVSIPKTLDVAPATSNGVLPNSKPGAVSPYTADVFSVPDQFLIRFGASLAVKKFDFSFGFRDDCLPVHDLVGGSDGYRRPGYVMAGEPGVSYHINKMTLYAYVPFAIIRDRTQSVADRRATEATGILTHGDAAFADYVINVGVTFKL